MFDTPENDAADGGPWRQEIDVQGKQEPVDWDAEPNSDDGLDPEARAELERGQ